MSWALNLEFGRDHEAGDPMRWLTLSIIQMIPLALVADPTCADSPIERIRYAQTLGPRYVVPSQLTQDFIKEPRETEPKDRSEPEKDTGTQGESQRELGFPEGAAGLRFVGSTAGQQRGSLVHDVLYRCELSDPGSAEAWAGRLCWESGAEDLTEASSGVVGSGQGRRLRRAPLRNAGWSHRLGKAEIEDLDRAVFRHLDIGGL